MGEYLSHRRRAPRLSSVLLAAATAVGLLAAAGASSAGASLAATRANASAVKPCPGARGVLCGNIRVPLYWAHPGQGHLTVHFQVYERTDRALPALDPIVAMEGGPGYPSTGSAASYLFMIGSLHERHDLILMDQRGTGGSDALDCPGVQDYDGLSRPDRYPLVVKACATSLGAGANAYGSAAVAEDLHAVLDTLGVDAIDLYGDSYGSYAAQVFALHYPRFVRALVLDGTYDQQFDPFEPEAVTALRRAWDTICRSFPGCKGQELLDAIATFDARLARHPLVAVADDEYDTRQHIDLTASAFAQLVFDATYSYTFFRDLPAAIVSADHGDLVPIERLAAEDVSFNAAGGAPSAYSAGDLMAVSCHDYPTAWKVASSVPARTAQLDAAIKRLPAGLFFPFPKEVWLRSLDENELVYGCLDWPRPTLSDPPFPAGKAFPPIPVLVLDGLLDQATPLGDAITVARDWPDATIVTVANSNHVTAQADFDHCISVIVRHFLSTRAAGDTACASTVPAQYVVPAFPTTLSKAPQATSRGIGDHSTALDRQAVWAAGATVGDALERWYNLLGGGPGYGLYGGTFSVAGSYYSYGPLVLAFKAVRFVPDLRVSGTASWNRTTSIVTARLTLEGPEGAGSVRLSWTTDTAGALASATGNIGGNPVSLEMPAPFSAHG